MSKSILIIYFIYEKYDFEYFILLIISEYLLSGILIFLFFIKEQHKISFNINLKLIKEILGSSFYIFIYGIGALIFFRIDLFMIENLLSNYEMGIYTAAFKVLTFFYFIPNIIAQTLYPRIIKMFKSTELDLRPLKKMYQLTFIMGLLVFLFIIIFGDNIINFLFGNDFEESKAILKILSFNIIFISLGSIYSKVIYSSNMEKRLFLRVIMAILINIFLNIILIPIFQLKGVAISTIVSLFFMEVTYDFFDKKLRELHLFKLKSILNIHK